MASKRTLRSDSRQTTPEYNINKISKNNSRTFKVSTKPVKKKTTSNERFSPIGINPSTIPRNDKGKNKESEPLQLVTEEETNMSEDLEDEEILQSMEEQSTFSSDTKENQTLLAISDSESATENKTPSFSYNIVGQKYSFSEQQNSGTPNLTNTIKPGKILVSPELIPGQTPQEKIDFLRKKLGELSTLKHLRLENPIGQPMIAAIFGNIIEAEQACNLQITENENTHFKIAPPLNTQEGNSHFIRMWDISTHFTKQDIADCFPNQIEIDYITLQESGPGKSAIVTFTNMSDYTEISQEWSITEGLYSCRIFPFYRTRETRMERELNSATLTQLPPNSTVADLEEIIKKTKAKTCYIPRDNTNQTKRFAFLTFTSSSDLQSKP